MSKIKQNPSVKTESEGSGGGFRTPVPSGAKSLESPGFFPDLNALAASSTTPLPVDPIGRPWSGAVRSDEGAVYALTPGEMRTSQLLRATAAWLSTWRGRFGDLSLVAELEGELRARAWSLEQVVETVEELRRNDPAAVEYLTACKQMLNAIGEVRS